MALNAKINSQLLRDRLNKQIPQRKLQFSIKLKELLSSYDKCLIISINNVSSNQIAEMRKEFRKQCRFLFGKNTLIRKIIRDYIKQTGNTNYMKLMDVIRGNCGLVFVNQHIDTNQLRKDIISRLRQSPAKPGVISPIDVFIPPGPTGMEPTQTAFFHSMNISTRINRGQIDIEEEVHIIKKGEKIGASQASLLSKMGIKPFYYGIKVTSIYEKGEIIDATVFDITNEDVAQSFYNGLRQVAALCATIKYSTIINIPHELINAYKACIALGIGGEFEKYSFDALERMRNILNEQENFMQDMENVHCRHLREESESEKSSSNCGPCFFGADESDSDSSGGGGYRGSYTAAMNDDDDDDNTIGLTVGGAKDVNNFRQCIEKNIIPGLKSITYNGLLYEYYFDTKTRQRKQGKNKNITNNEGVEDDGSDLFYPSYCCAKVRKIDFIKDRYNGEFEYYLSVGLNSKIKKTEFKRKHLNLVIVLDHSYSMTDSFDGENISCKQCIANKAVLALLTHLTANDRFGMVIFDDSTKIIQKIQDVNPFNMNGIRNKILQIDPEGGTDFYKGYIAAIRLFDALDTNKLTHPNYDNRIIFVTDAHPTHGITSSYSLMGLVHKYANQQKYNIFTTIIGVGLDFNSTLIEEITSVKGCNYYVVKSTQDFMNRMDEEFEYMVTPLVFNVSLKMLCKDDTFKIDTVYGVKDDHRSQMISNGEIKKIGTLFPSKKSKIKGGTKGGIQIIKLIRNDGYNGDDINVELEVKFETIDGKKYFNKQLVKFKPPTTSIMNDMIDFDSDDDKQEEEEMNFYDNIGIRKGILLCKYVELLHLWIQETSTNRDKFKEIFNRFLKYFEKELIYCKDDELKKEIDILNKIKTQQFRNNQYGSNYGIYCGRRGYNSSSSDDDSSSD